MMSQCVVPNWNNVRHQRQEQVEEEGNKFSHVHNQHNPTHVVHMSDYGVRELTWENGQLAMHGLPTPLPKTTWPSSGDTLESIVHQATYHNQTSNLLQDHHRTPANISSTVASSARKWPESSGKMQIDHVGFMKKRKQSNSDQNKVNFSSSSMLEEYIAERSDACASASTAFCRENDAIALTWASFESPQNLKTRIIDEDSACHDGSEIRDGEQETRGETGRSHSTRRRVSATHNQSERRRRDRINQKMKALQKLVPNASKTDKASMLDEVIDYLKQLQAQVHLMTSVRSMPQMMMPIDQMQQQMQMTQFLARMGMGGVGMGMGMADMTSTMARPAPQTLPPMIRPSPVATATPSFVLPPFMVPPMIPTPPTSANLVTNTSTPFNHPYCALLAQQSMNMDLYNKMAALYRQQVNQSSQAASGPSQSHHGQGV